MAWSYVGLALLAAVLFYVVRSIQGYRRLAHISGPFLAGWTDLWLVWGQLSGQLNFTLLDVSKQYGECLFLSPLSYLHFLFSIFFPSLAVPQKRPASHMANRSLPTQPQPCYLAT